MAATKENLVTASWADRSQSLPLPSSNKADSSVNELLFRYFIIKVIDGSFENISPFFIHKCIQSKIGKVESIRKLRSGDLLVKTASVSQTVSIIDCKTLGHLNVSVSPHSTLNFSRGVISEPDLLYTPEQEILENLNDQQVCSVRRITIRRDGKIIATKHLILTFSIPDLPKYIMAGYLRCPVRPYIPNPLRCFQCQRFGHSKLSCRGSVACARCSEAGHDSEKCVKSPQCVNCKGAHPSFSRACPTWKIEKEIQNIKHQNNLSYPEARKIVISRTPRPGISYSNALATKSVKSVATQTELSQCSILNRLPKPNFAPNSPTTSSVSSVKTSKRIEDSTTRKRGKVKANMALKMRKQTNTEKKPQNPFKSTHTRTDFLKKPPKTTPGVQESEESVKCYVSPEEDMFTDCSVDSEAGVSNTAPR
jgi:hypothetical protein